MRFVKESLKIMRDVVSSLLSYKKPKYIDAIAIIRVDAIGDYLLFRNFLEEIKNHYSNSKITLIGNYSYMNLAINLDSQYFDNAFWIDRKKFAKNLIYRIYFLRKIKTFKYGLCINPIYSRDSISDFIAKNIYANEKIAFSGDIHISNQSTKIYTKLIEGNKNIIFEFYRNKEFFCKIFKKELNTKLHIDKTKLPRIEYLKNKFNLPQNYNVLFIGASSDYRKWSIENFAEVGAYLINSCNESVIICGGKEDSNNAYKLENLIYANLDSNLQNKIKSNNLKILNLVGKSSLMELGSIVYNGNLLISNETSCVHLGSILDTTIIIVVSNGNHLGRFIPYPKEIRDKYYPVFHPFIENNIDKYRELSNQFAYKSTLNINEIDASKIINLIDKRRKND